MFVSRSNTFDSDFSLQMLLNLPQGVAGFRAIRNAQQKLVDLECIFLNPAGEKILGRRAENIVGSSLLKTFPGNQKESFFERLVSITESGKAETIMYVFPNEKGYPKWVNAYCCQLEDVLLITLEEITTQRRMEEQLRESQQFIHSITEASPEIIYVYDLKEGRNLYINQRMNELIGFSREETEGADFFNLIHPDDRIRLNNGIQKLVSSSDNEVIEDEYRIRTAEGAWRWILNRLVVFRRDTEGFVCQVVGSARDITKRKRMDDELQQQQHLIASIADATPDVIMLMDLIENRVVYINRNLVNKGGVSGVRLSTENETDRAQIVLQEDLLKRAAYLKGFSEAHDNEVREMEYRMKDFKGQWRWYWTRGKVFRRLPDGRVWQVILIGQDVTEKKEGQRQLKLLNDQLKAEQEKLQDLNNELENRVATRTRELEESVRNFRSMLESIPQMAWTAAPNGQFTYFNQPWYYHTGLTPSGSLDSGWQSVIHPDDREMSVERWEESWNTGKELYVENRILRASDGEYRWHLVRANPIIDHQGKITLWVGTCTDTHDMKMAMENLSRANAALDSFVHMAAHDLKSPVTNLKSLLQLLRNANQTDATALVAAIEASTLRLDNTIEGLIEILEVQTDYEIPARKVNFQQVSDHLLMDFANELDRCGGTITTDFGNCDSICYVEAYLTSIFRNLISNAIKYRSPYRPLQIHIQCRQEEEFVELTVQDNGIGINLKQYGKDLFKPFTRLTTQAHGKGLGLHLMKNMIEKNGGKIRVVSEPDQGTTFHVYLISYDC